MIRIIDSFLVAIAVYGRWFAAGLLLGSVLGSVFIGATILAGQPGTYEQNWELMLTTISITWAVIGFVPVFRAVKRNLMSAKFVP